MFVRRFVFVLTVVVWALDMASLTAADCNGNAAEDVEEIAAATVEDCNFNGIPDECEGPVLAFNERVIVPFSHLVKNAISTDLNNDGLVDFVVGHLAGVSLRFGDGRSEFEALDEVNLLRDDVVIPEAWDAGDVDGDGSVDLVALESARALVLWNDGTGQFDTTSAFPLRDGMKTLALVDVNGDRAADIVAVNRSLGTLNVVLSLAERQFSEPLAFAVGEEPRRLAIGDFDGDLIVDFAVVNRRSADVSILYGEGDGSFVAGERLLGFGPLPETIVAADFNDDGFSDLAVGDRLHISVLLNQGGVFGIPQPLLHEGTRVLAFTAGDADGDGDIDLAVNYNDPVHVAVFTNRGDGGFNAGRYLHLDFRAVSILMQDVDLDGAQDLLFLSSASRSIIVLWNRESAETVPFSASKTIPAGGRPHTLGLVDFDGDGDLDVITGNNYDFTLSFLHNPGDGLFEAEVRRVDITSFGLVARDFDGDTVPDLASVPFPSPRVAIYVNDGTGQMTLRGGDRNGGTFLVPDGPYHIGADDLDGDGTIDIFTSHPGQNIVSIIFNDGAAAFSPSTGYQVGDTPRSATAVDLDQDGDLDLAVANEGSSSVSVLLNDGSGVFSDATNHPVTGQPSFVLAADMDGDGFSDLVTAHRIQGEIGLLWNAADGTGDMELADRYDALHLPYSIVLADFNGDGRRDVASVEETGSGGGGGSVFIGLNRGDRSFAPPSHLSVGSGPRFIVAGDLDGDEDIDLVSGNRGSHDVTVYLSRLDAEVVPDFYESICTVEDFFDVSLAARPHSGVVRNGKFVLAARDGLSHPALFQNVNRFRLHEEFLATTFPDEFGFILDDPVFYEELIGRRATRDYYAGTLDLRRNDDGLFYTFSVVTDTGFDPREVLTQAEVSEVYARLQTHFSLDPLVYGPISQLARDAVSTWVDSDVPVFIDNTPPPFQFEPYTLGLGYGRLRIMTLEEFEAANREGRFTFQDGIVIEKFSPPDIEGVVGFVFTGGVQGELAHLPIRTARRGTPNAFVSNVRDKFGEFDGQLVRVEVFPENFFVTPVEVSEAEEFWEQIRRELSSPPAIDVSYGMLDSFLQMDLAGRPEGRYGGKASNLGRLQRVLLRDGTLDSFIESGFGIPTRYYGEFMQSNFRGAQSYEEYIQEILASEDVRTDSGLRFQLLDEFRQFVRDNGEVDANLVQDLALKIESVFGDLTTMVRFRSSSNAEDALVFNGAGLYESTSVCALDTLDRNDRNSSHCDPSRSSERTIERALKKVWSSLWTFRAHEERTFYQIDPASAVMGIAVTRSFLDETANGVAFTGSPRDVEDKRYVVTAQVGEGSVVSPPAGTTVERTLLEVGTEGEVENIIRSRASNQVDPGVVVVSDEDLRELARFMWRVESAWEIDLPEDVDQNHVILDFEFKVEPDGSLAVKQIRPFLIPSVDLVTPTFELEIPLGTILCSSFSEELSTPDPRGEYEVKSQVRLRNGVFEVPTDKASFSGMLIEEVRWGPSQEIAQPVGEGRFDLVSLPDAGSQTLYRLSFSQDFVLANGDELTISLDNLTFRGRGSIAIEKTLRVDEDFITFDPAFSVKAALNGEPQTTQSSCTYRGLPRWELVTEVNSTSRITLYERFRPSENENTTEPATLEKAIVEIEGQQQVVENYWRLVYAAARHNTDVHYWAILDPVLDVPGLERPVRVVEVAPPDFVHGRPTTEVRYLDANFTVLQTSLAQSYTREEAPLDPGVSFVRGDVDGDTRVDIGDAVRILEYLFARGARPSCLASADTDDDGRVNLLDAIQVLLHLFGGSGPLPAPADACGFDPTPGDLPCARHAPCAAQ